MLPVINLVMWCSASLIPCARKSDPPISFNASMGTTIFVTPPEAVGVFLHPSLSQHLRPSRRICPAKIATGPTGNRFHFVALSSSLGWARRDVWIYAADEHTKLRSRSRTRENMQKRLFVSALYSALWKRSSSGKNLLHRGKSFKPLADSGFSFSRPGQGPQTSVPPERGRAERRRRSVRCDFLRLLSSCDQFLAASGSTHHAFAGDSVRPANGRTFLGNCRTKYTAIKNA